MNPPVRLRRHLSCVTQAAARTLVCALITSGAVPALAGESDTQFWLAGNANIRLDSNSNVVIDTSQRFRSARVGDDLTLGRVTFDQRVAPWLSVGGGVALFSTDERNEGRFHQQVVFTSGMFSSRTMLEQRFGDAIDGIGWRLRERVQVMVPVGDNGWRLFANGEAFFALNPIAPGSKTGLDAIRLATGVRAPLSRHSAISVGYLYQHQFRDNRPDRNSHIPTLTLSVSL